MRNSSNEWEALRDLPGMIEVYLDDLAWVLLYNCFQLRHGVLQLVDTLFRTNGLLFGFASA